VKTSDSDISGAEHQAIAQIHQAESAYRFGKAMFDLMVPRLAHELLFIAFLPIKFELPSLFSDPKYKDVCDRYVRESNKYDIWLRRSPIGPEIKFVRHSDFTPPHILKKSSFFKEVMVPLNSEFGASIVAWHDQNWLATLTIFRNRQQGDLTEPELEQLRGWQFHFEAAARRVAMAKEERLDDDSLSAFLWNLPTAALILDWEGAAHHFNAAAIELCNVWQYGMTAFSKKAASRLRVPPGILAILPAIRTKVEVAKLSRPGPRRPVELETLVHPVIPGLSAKISFVPSKTLSLTRGRFLIQLHYNQLSIGSASVFTNMARLSRTEREVAVHAARGLSNQQIGQTLHKSPGTVKVQLSHIFKKLQLRSRVELANVLSAAPNLRSASVMGRDKSIQILN
jgi:DNA-binding CsgD family transcriptional regulator